MIDMHSLRAPEVFDQPYSGRYRDVTTNSLQPCVDMERAVGSASRALSAPALRTYPPQATNFLIRVCWQADGLLKESFKPLWWLTPDHSEFVNCHDLTPHLQLTCVGGSSEHFCVVFLQRSQYNHLRIHTLPSIGEVISSDL